MTSSLHLSWDSPLADIFTLRVGVNAAESPLLHEDFPPSLRVFCSGVTERDSLP